MMLYNGINQVKLFLQKTRRLALSVAGCAWSMQLWLPSAGVWELLGCRKLYVSFLEEKALGVGCDIPLWYLRSSESSTVALAPAYCLVSQETSTGTEQLWLNHCMCQRAASPCPVSRSNVVPCVFPGTSLAPVSASFLSSAPRLSAKGHSWERTAAPSLTYLSCSLSLKWSAPSLAPDSAVCLHSTKFLLLWAHLWTAASYLPVLSACLLPP